MEKDFEVLHDVRGYEFGGMFADGGLDNLYVVKASSKDPEELLAVIDDVAVATNTMRAEGVSKDSRQKHAAVRIDPRYYPGVTGIVPHRIAIFITCDFTLHGELLDRIMPIVNK